MTHVSFEEYEAAKAEIIGGVHYKEKSTLEGNVIRKTYPWIPNLYDRHGEDRAQGKEEQQM